MNTGDGLMLAARTVGGLVIVLVLVALSARIARRSRHFGHGDGLRVVERVGLSRDAQLVVVEAAGRQLLLGVGPSGVRLVTHLDDRPDDRPDDGARAALDAAVEAVETPAPEPVRIPVVEQIFGPVPAPEPAPQPVFAPEAYEEPQAEPGPSPEPFEEPVTEASSPRRGRRAKDTPVDQGRQPMTRAERRAMERALEQVDSPEPAPPTEAPEPSDDRDRVHVPAADYNGYPDLASALRAMGRTTDRPAEPTDADAPASAAGSAVQGLPTQRRSPETDLSHATSSAPQPPSDDEADGPESRRDRRRRRVVQPRQQQASGSVLSPATWRQGIDALRDLTARRG
ncbi:flagellar biosynthetic protein FliO [Spongisporangium articulatum]|uniref:Flagellar biosynthetic protein FliO n=1 Tax=Spongisporangium articulatum TaxID=3362603 RepID=A0ABW8AHQ0_9ACTN